MAADSSRDNDDEEADSRPSNHHPSSLASQKRTRRTRGDRRRTSTSSTPTTSSSSSSSPNNNIARDDTDPSSSSSNLIARQQADSSAIAAARDECWLRAGFGTISCYPTTDTEIRQGEWTGVVWNSNLPWFTQRNLVDLYLHRADSGEQILHYRNVENPRNQAGFQPAPVNDSWWGDDGPSWDGEDKTFSFYWTVVDSRTGLNGNGAPLPQAVFNAIQTSLPTSIIDASSTASPNPSSIGTSSGSSASDPSATATDGDSTGNSPGNPGAVQPNSNDSDFPDWAIAVIVILGFFAIVATCVLIFIILRRVRRRRSVAASSNRGSMGSASPMMQNAGANPSEPTSPLLASHHHGGGGGSPYTGHHGTNSALGAAGAGALAGVALARAGSSRHGDPHNQPPSSDRAVGGFNDGASTISRTQSTTGESGPFSGADAAIMADAFRKALRKPDFAGRPVEEGESPDNGDGGDNRSSDDRDGLGAGVLGVMNEEDRRARERERERKRMMSRELAEEGRDIRSVASSRGVRVETMSDSGSTVQDHGGRND